MDNIDAILRKSEAVQSGRSRSDRKSKGVFYTPLEVIDYMIEKTLGSVDLAVNPYVKILDPACGSGLFLIKAFEMLKRKFEADYERIVNCNKGIENALSRDGIGKFIVENNLWGADIDPVAIDTAKSSLLELAGAECKPRLLCCDGLVSGITDQSSFLSDITQEEYEFWNSDYDYIIGNPPYVGHKKVPGGYKKMLQQLYNGIYRDKSDIYYCFIKRGIDLLKQGGTLSFITSRYFMEGPSAAGLRKYISSNCKVTDIVDFNGLNVFEDAGVAACIITLVKGTEPADARIAKYIPGNVASGSGKLFEQGSFEHFMVKNLQLKEEGWVIINPDKYEVFSIVESKGTHTLGELFESYQGIITGCDKAFIVDANTAEANKIEKCLLRPWIKNSSVEKFRIMPPEKYIIYSDFIKDEADFPNALEFIAQYKDRLLRRRECMKGVRKWYQLQWGRKNEVFEAPKIVYPFKAASSRFAVDDHGYYCSADVYSLKLREKYRSLLTLEYVTAILNSRLFEFYFKCYAKKISNNLYDYYPNTVLRMKIPMPEADNPIQDMAAELKKCKNEERRKAIIYQIDRELYKLYGLNEKQIEIIEM